MPQVEIKIGGRTFEVACQSGEEQFLMTAAAMLDVEAASLSTQIGRMPESRMLLMAGLLLADRTAGLEDKLRDAEHKLAELQAQLDDAKSNAKTKDGALPDGTVAALTSLVERAEAIAARTEG